MKIIRANSKRWLLRIRNEVLIFYSENPPKCKCCGENTYEFLSIDHINGGGSKQKREILGSRNIYSWLRHNNFPEGYQVLCHNCNLAKGFYGKCPHETQVDQQHNHAGR
jgi:hypothetical protein